MKKSEIKKLEDKDLQLRYYLGGLKFTENANHPCHYWTCDINCSCSIVPDDENLIEVKKFIKKYNMTNEDFLKITFNYLIGSIMKYKGEYSPLFIELEQIIKPYDFGHNNRGKVLDSDFREKELEKLVSNNSKSPGNVEKFISKNNLTLEDFMVFAKTSLNINYYGLRGLNNDPIEYLYDLRKILNSKNLYASREYVVEYREAYEKNRGEAELITDVKHAQKEYLKSLKELLEKDPNLAIDIISQELNELTLNTKKIKEVQKSLRKSYIK